MPRFLLAVTAVAAALSLSPSTASADACRTTRQCTTFVCGGEIEDHCVVDRCYYFTDYPTCVYPVIEPICFYPYDGAICLPWTPR
jgi:hypothetical protein